MRSTILRLCSMVEPRDALWNALLVLPKPVGYAAVVSCALATVDATKAAQFIAWLDDNKGYLLGRLNG